MDTCRRIALGVASALLSSLIAATGALGQVCGDADGNGNVTVTDGVQVLRAAAGLSSTCADQPENCDIDGNRSITITDGVNVLRKGAELPVTEACPAENADVITVTDDSVSFLVLGLHQLPTTAGAAQAAATENCQDGGTRTTDTSGGVVTVRFAACRVSDPDLGDFQFDGSATLDVGSAQVTFDLTITDTEDGHAVRFAGSIAVSPQAGGGFVADGGPVVVTSSVFTFRLTFDHLAVDADGHLASGTATAEDSERIFDLRSAAIDVENGSTNATVHVVFDDDSTKDFILNLQTADLTPASSP